ncbi:hypothetical protein HHK36_023686 [Tetracentron sinense]|uniref:Beta-glucosidase n=1 Tax=Tetracentron sinense TaxID=13715 RepID=A0A835D851_TETSI|nr:hypothetical protein HHK36_023686 [Tetracentron sinense]
MYEPMRDEEVDREAANRALAFKVAWLLDPLIHGDYPPEMRLYLGHNLPKISLKESKILKDSLDFIGINHYSTLYAKDCIHSPCSSGGHAVEGFVDTIGERDGIPIGEPTAMDNFYIVPYGMEKIIGYLKTRYNNKPMFVTENGIAQMDRPSEQGGELLNDVKRIKYHKGYLASLARVIRDGADVRGYFEWSLMDNFEWRLGYRMRFGLYYVNFETLKRTPKLSARWFTNFLANITQKNKQKSEIEGAFLEGGKSLSNWDVFSHIPGNIDNGGKADVADDHYHLYMEDMEMMHSLGVNAYRFSISWERILPRGRFGGINPIGIMFYNKIIDTLLHKGIEPFVTINHHDIPQELEDRYGSWLSPLIQEDLAYYAETCFKSFGDRVKYWTTINEPNHLVDFAYIKGLYPPSHCSTPFGNCSVGNSEIEPIITLHNFILSHAKAADLYRKHYQPKQGGCIGIVVHAFMYEPMRDEEVDREAANRALAFKVAWLLDPLIHGDYPPEMRRYLGQNLPKFSLEESKILKHSLDFIGINHYSTLYAKDCIHSPCSSEGHAIEGFVYTTGERDGIPIGEPTPINHFFIVPDGLEKIISYLKTRYNNKPMFVTENGIAQLDRPSEQGGELLNDVKRIEYHKGYLASLARTIRDGADVRGYFVWSLMDNFEWTNGYNMRFGLYYVDFETLKRTPKLSARWYRNFLNNITQTNRQEIIRYSSKKDSMLSLPTEEA